MDQYVKLIGFKNNPYPYIKNANLFVCSSRHESFSLVVAESLILSTPVISTYCTGPTELLDNGEYGMLVENSEDGLYYGLSELLKSNDKLESYKRKACKRKKFFDIESTIKRWETILDSNK